MILSEVPFHPIDMYFRLVKRFKPDCLWHRYGRLARYQLFKKLYLVLSFDIDTPEDAGVVLEMDKRLRDMGTMPSYAVPGSLLEREYKTFEVLLNRKAEFLNHGKVQHTVWKQEFRRYESCFFYHKLSRKQVKEDIEKGNEAFQRILGIRPKGFRTPHFGTFQEEDQIRFFHSVLKELHYQYSSSTVPYYSFRYGPVIHRFGLFEFPLTGVFSRPMDVQDSWGFYGAPDRQWGSKDYLAEARAMTHFCQEKQAVGLLNYYADPSDVWNEPSFYQSVQSWLQVAQPISFEKLCQEFPKN